MLRVETRTIGPGRVEMPASLETVLLVHAGEPVVGACSRRRYRVVPGDIDILPAGLSGEWTCDQPTTSLVITIPSTLLRVAAQDAGRDPDRIQLAPRHHVRDMTVEHLAWALAAEERAGNPSGRLLVESLGIALALKLMTSDWVTEIAAFGLGSRELARVLEYIEEHLDQRLSIVDLAAVVPIGPSQFKVMFKRSTGATVHQYVLRRRVERARKLLAGGELPRSEIALAAGFSHQSHMARWMRRILGVYPG